MKQDTVKYFLGLVDPVIKKKVCINRNNRKIYLQKINNGDEMLHMISKYLLKK